jgi:hypothetical protein
MDPNQVGSRSAPDTSVAIHSTIFKGIVSRDFDVLFMILLVSYEVCTGAR